VSPLGERFKAALSQPKPARTIKRVLAVDLHGYSRKEAVDKVWSVLAGLASWVEKVNFITGRGVHSRNETPLLRPMLLRMFEEGGIPAAQMLSNPGIVQVFARPATAAPPGPEVCAPDRIRQEPVTIERAQPQPLALELAPRPQPKVEPARLQPLTIEPAQSESQRPELGGSKRPVVEQVQPTPPANELDKSRPPVIQSAESKPLDIARSPRPPEETLVLSKPARDEQEKTPHVGRPRHDGSVRIDPKHLEQIHI
jgi:hypothetical protein